MNRIKRYIYKPYMRICKYCGRIFDKHIPEGDGTFWCGDYEVPEATPSFEPSGRVSVPVELIEAVHELIKREIILGVQRDGIEVKILTMLTDIEKGGEG